MQYIHTIHTRVRLFLEYSLKEKSWRERERRKTEEEEEEEEKKTPRFGLINTFHLIGSLYCMLI